MITKKDRVIEFLRNLKIMLTKRKLTNAEIKAHIIEAVSEYDEPILYDDTKLMVQYRRQFTISKESLTTMKEKRAKLLNK
jgi:hypothetical protein